MPKIISETLYKDNNSNSRRTIGIEIKNGLVTFYLQDIGSLCEEMFGDSDYERSIFDLPVEQLRKAFRVKTNQELIAIIKREYNTVDAFDRFQSFIDNLHLKYSYYSG